MSVASITSSVQAAAQQLQNTSGTHRHHHGGRSGSGASTGIASLSTLMNAAPTSSNTSIATVASNLFKLPGLASSASPVSLLA